MTSKCLAVVFAGALAFGAVADAEASLAFYLSGADANDTIDAKELATHHALAKAGLVDSLEFGTFADPGTGVGLTSSTVSSKINGSGYTLTVKEHGYTGGGTFVDLVPARTANFNGTSYLFSNESPASQGGADAYGWGYDTISKGSPNSSTSAQQTLLFDFTASATDVGTFSFSLLDFESGLDLSAYIAVWDESGSFLQSWDVDYGGSPYGDQEAHQAYIQSDGDALGYVALVVGDNDNPANMQEQMATGDFYVGGFAAMVPEPGAALPMAALLLVMVGYRRSKNSPQARSTA